MRALLLLLVLSVPTVYASAQQQFDVVSIHLSRGEVRFERDGETTVSGDTLRMRDVTVSTCIKLAYHVQQSQIVAQEGMDQQHYDITAKAEAPLTSAGTRAMLQQLLADRFNLRLHRGTRELDAYVLTVSPQGLKMKPSADPQGEPWHQNSAMGMVGRNFTVADLADYVSGPLGTPLVDETGLPGRYDFTIDFQPYVDNATDIHADPQAVLRTSLAGELGLRMTRKKVTVETLVVDRVSAPQDN